MTRIIELFPSAVPVSLLFAACVAQGTPAEPVVQVVQDTPVAPVPPVESDPAPEPATATGLSAATEPAVERAPEPDALPPLPVVSRADAHEAIRLANEGDRAVKINVEGAVEKYASALQLDPTNALIAYKLAQAHERRQDWERMGSALTTAIALDPGDARFHFKRGYAMVKRAEAGESDQYETAKASFRRCLELDPSHAECHYFLGTAAEYTVDDQTALESYTRAIQSDPEVAYFYPPLAALYLVHKRYREAAQTLAEATRRIAPTDANVDALYAIHILKFQVAQAEGDDLAMIEALERAHDVAGDAHPEIAFHLGASYANQVPPQKEKAVRLLMSFAKRACRGARAGRYVEQCRMAQSLLQELGAP